MKLVEKKILLTKHFSPEFLNSKFSKPLKIFSKDYIIRDFVPIEKIENQLNDEKDFILTSKKATQHILQLPISGNFYCVGETSGNLLKKQNKNVITVQDDASHLAEWLIANYNSKNTLVYFCSAVRGEILPKALKSNDISLKEIITYNTLPTNLKEENKYDAYVFFSPSGVKSFHQKNHIHKKASIFAIGETTGAALKSLGYKNVMTPDRPRTKDLFNKIQNYYDH